MEPWCKNKVYEGFTSKYGVDKLGYYEVFNDIKDAIIREFKEESNIRVKIDRLLYVTENFFEGKLGKFHELGFYYLLVPQDKVISKDYQVIEKDKDGDMKLDFKRIAIEKLNNFKPEFLKNELRFLDKECKHIIISNDKII